MKRILFLSLSALLAACASSNADLATQQDVDLNKYMGTWYEQARLPNSFQRECAGDVQANYVMEADKTIGQGRLSSSMEPADPAILEVRFAPKWLSWFPMVWGDYWIMKLEGDYQYSLVGTPDRKYLWVLSREKQADPQVVSDLLDYAAAQGFSVEKLVSTKQ
jgi:apolipoprotein D and lipocalin family protein